MITAYEARTASKIASVDINNASEVQRWLSEVADKAVREASRNGELGVWVDGPRHDELALIPAGDLAKKHLRSIGYKTWNGGCDREGQILISWRHLS